MDTPSLAGVLIVSATYGAALGIASDFMVGKIESTVGVRPGDSLFDEQLTFRAALMAEVTCIHGPIALANSAAATLVIVIRNGAGATQTITMTLMKLVNFQHVGNRDAPPFAMKHQFVSSGASTIVYS